MSGREERPELRKDLDSAVFADHYWLKEELAGFCRDNGLPSSGSKQELTERIKRFLDGKEAEPASSAGKKTAIDGEITPDRVIEENIVCSEKHRAFFRQHIGSSFTFNVAFQKWLKSNAGMTYGDAIDAYRTIIAERKHSKTTIDKQFEYNTYIRDFFADNKGRTLDDAIKCWKYKKSSRGHNRYERADLAALGDSGKKQ